MEKIFINVTAEHDSNGNIRPLTLKWTDGRIFTIDRVIDVRQAAALKAGGCGIRYRCKVHGKVVDLFCDEGRWFIDK